MVDAPIDYYSIVGSASLRPNVIDCFLIGACVLKGRNAWFFTFSIHKEILEMNRSKAANLFTVLVVILLAAVLTAGVYGQETEQLRMGITGDESTLNPFTYVTGNPGWNMLLLQYDTLYQLDGDGVPQPWLATGSEVSEDALTVTINLREDVTWHDGQPLTANDVKFTVD